jgi:hypothetical protein
MSIFFETAAAMQGFLSPAEAHANVRTLIPFGQSSNHIPAAVIWS